LPEKDETMDVKTQSFVKEARKELKNPDSRMFLDFYLPVLSAVREIGLTSFPDPTAAVEQSRAIRRNAVADLGNLLETFERNAVKNGANVFWAENSAAANAYIRDLVNRHNVPYVTKGKSMICEETGLNGVLENNGTDVFETDLGEFIIQLLEKPPFHIIGPAINIPPDEICRVFMEKAGMEKATTDPVELGQTARKFLREKFRGMKLGITGVNMAVAETGSIINVENEGNIRFNKSAPEIQVSVMSIEKIVPTLSDAIHMLRMLCRNGTGQKLTSYVTMDTGPRKQGELDGPSELHIVILDNGRSRIHQNPRTREVLQCIRCGACINICPVFRQIGGYPYGWAYTGPIGKLLNPLLLGLERTKDLYGACTLCKACKIVCPAGIDHPSMILYFRNRNMEKDRFLNGNGSSFAEKAFAFSAAFAGSHPTAWNLGTKIAKALARRLGPGNTLFKPWTDSRKLPEFPRTSYRDIRNKTTE
jgi:L-lactate dehydrogenase complex protein LldF